MRRLTLLTVLLCLYLLPRIASSQVPQLITYQGRVAVGGVNFNGIGQLKFALVNGNGSSSWWSNDGTSVSGSEPSAFVSISVSNGLFSVALGDAALGMTPIPPDIFTSPDVRLRIWFSDGVHGSQLLAPDQRLTASGYAMMAANLVPGAAAANLQAGGQSGVPSGGMILSTNPSSANLLAAGYVSIGQFGSLTNGSSNGVGTNESWQAPSPASPPSIRTDHTAIWTGSKMIVWGGYNGTSYLNTGGIYDPAANTWTPTAVNGSIPGRDYQIALWTGSEMLIWGGYLGGTNYANDGWRYNPTANSWTAMAASGIPGRDVPAAVWTGTEMIIWGGYNSGVNGGGAFLFDGARYSPVSNVWTHMNTAGSPPARQFPAAIWTGSEMVIWGGYGDQTYLNDGWIYHPGTDTWTPISSNGAPRARFLHSVVWTGSQMIVWGGVNAGGYLNDGGCYTPASDTWTSITTSGAPIGRKFHSAVWTGSEMVIWGGYNAGNLQDGARYDPAGNSWRTTTPTGAPAARENHSAVWTGSQMLLWGGDASGTSYFNDLFQYTLSGGGGASGTQPLYLYLKQ